MFPFNIKLSVIFNTTAPPPFPACPSLNAPDPPPDPNSLEDNSFPVNVPPDPDPPPPFPFPPFPPFPPYAPPPPPPP